MDIEIKGSQLVAPEKVYELIEEQRKLEVLVKQNEARLNEFKEALMAAMETHGIKKWENDALTVTYVPATLRTTVDTAKMKAEGIYDQYTKESAVKASIRLKFKEKSDDLPY